MRRRRAAMPAAAAAVAAPLLALLAAGCDTPAPRAGVGPEIVYLNSRPPALSAAASGPQALLPLTPGDTWDMKGTTQGPDGSRGAAHAPYTVRVAGAAPPAAGGPEGTLVEIWRGGTLWRREVYKSGPGALSLQAAAEEDRPWMVFAPAIPLAHYPLSEGQSLLWSGTFRYSDQSFPATAFSRVSAVEPVATGQGRLLAYRIDTQVQVSMGEGPMKFPTVRWLAPGVGFAERAFMDSDKGVYTHLLRFHGAPSTAPATPRRLPQP